MSTDPMDALRRELGAEPAATLGTLAADDLRDLAGLVHEARGAQAAALDAAASSALGQLPRPLRGPVTRTLGL